MHYIMLCRLLDQVTDGKVMSGCSPTVCVCDMRHRRFIATFPHSPLPHCLIMRAEKKESWSGLPRVSDLLKARI